MVGEVGEVSRPHQESYSWWGLFLPLPGAAWMNVITITREYGAGGGEVARKLAESPRLGTARPRIAPSGGRGRARAGRRVGAARRKGRHHGRPLSPAPAPSKVPSRPDRGGPPSGRTGQRDPGRPRCTALVGRDGPTRSICGWSLRKQWRAQRMAQLEGWSSTRPGPGVSKWTAVRGLFTRYFFGDKAATNRPSTIWFSTRAACRWTTWRAWSPQSFAPAPRRRSARPGGRRVLTLSRELGPASRALRPRWPSG